MESLNPSPLSLRLGQAIKARRVIMGISLKQLAQDVGVCYQQVQNYENGDNNMSVLRFALIADALHITPAQLWDLAAPDPAQESEASSRAILEMMKRFHALTKNEQTAISASVRILAEKEVA